MIKAARDADEELRDEGIVRRGAAETAVVDFAGAYSVLFQAACRAESDDRGRLAGVLDALADQVTVAKLKANQERERQELLAAWEVREADRESRRRQSLGVADGVLGAPLDEVVFDPKPSEYPVCPPTVSAAYAPVERTRTSTGAAGEVSSADPDHLRTFVSQSRASNTGMARECRRVRDAWAAFIGSCSWVPVGSTTLVGGFERLLAENRADAKWIEQIADAFDAAGSGSLSNHALDLAATAVSPMSDQELLRALSSLPPEELTALLSATPALRVQLEGMAPAVVFSWWSGLNPPADAGARFSVQQDALLTEFPVLFGNLEGMPYGARDYANQIALTAATADAAATVAELQAAYDAASGRGGETPSVAMLRERLEAARAQLDALHNIQGSLMSATEEGEEARFLISLTEDRPPLGAVSIGNLDTATSITYAVPGMGTTTAGMTRWAEAAQNLHDRLLPNSAVVAWIGYDTPPMPTLDNPDLGVRDMDRAVAGGNNLAAALGGLAAVRAETMPQTGVIAHSYGSTTAAVALSQPGVRADTFVTLGSAGLPNNVRTADDLNAGTVYAGQARDRFDFESESGDQWAWVGRAVSPEHRINPVQDDFGAEAFRVESGGDAGRVVTDHSVLMADAGEDAGYLDKNTESLRNTAWAISGQPELITDRVPLGPTRFTQAVADWGTYGY
ncbi:MAG: alpha/beta hydrolase [Actinomycetota bacterium]